MCAVKGKKLIHIFKWFKFGEFIAATLSTIQVIKMALNFQ